MNLYGQSPAAIKRMLGAEVTRRKQECRNRNLFFEEYDRLYYLQHYGEKKPGYFKGRKGIMAQVNDATTQVDLRCNLIGVKDLKIKVFPRWVSEGELAAGSEIERWVYAVLEANNDRIEDDVLDLVLFDAIRLGWGGVYSYWDDDVVKQSMMEMPPQAMAPQMAQGMPQPGAMPQGMPQGMGAGQGMQVITECPIVIEPISPYYLYPEKGGPQGRWRSFLVIEDKKNAQEVYQEWGIEPKALKEAKIDQKHTTTVQYVVYWGWERIEDKNWVVNCVMADDEIIRPPTIMEYYDALPITVFFCQSTGDPRWEYMYLSSLFPIHLDVKLLDHLLTRLHKQVDQLTNLPIFRKKPRTGPSTSLKMMQGMYNIVDLEADESIETYKWQGNPPDFHALFSIEQQKIREGGFSSLALGETIDVSGISASRQWESNVVKLMKPTKSFARGLKSLLKKITGLAVSHAPDMPISLITNYPKATGNVMLMGSQLEPYVISPELVGELPMDQFRRLALGLQLSQLPPQLRILSDETLLERFFDVDQPETEFEKRLIDLARASKTLQLIQTYQYLRSQGLPIDITLLAQLEGMAGMQQQQAPMRQPGQTGLQQGQQMPQQAVSTAMSPYEPGTSTLAETEFQGQAPGEGGAHFLRGLASPPGGFGGGRR